MPNTDYIQNPDQVARARGYHVAALTLLDKGFTAKMHRKDAIDLLNRAYDVLVKEALDYALWSRRTRGEDRWIWDDEADHQFYIKHNVPDLHVWKHDKHAPLWVKYNPDAVTAATILAGDRALVMAAPIQAKPKSKTQLELEARLLNCKRCQICDRPILAERGKIAHHGYQRPHGQGYHTASCFGAMELPFEEDRGALGKYIENLKIQLAKAKIDRQSVADEIIALYVSYHTGKYDGMGKPVYNRFLTKRGTYNEQRETHAKQARWPDSNLPKTFDIVKERELKKLDADIKNQELYLTGQQIRFNDWEILRKRPLVEVEVLR